MRSQSPGPARRILWAAVAGAASLTVHTAVNVRLLRRPDPDRPGTDVPPLVSILIPARNEATRLGPTVRAALEQDHPRLEVLVLDDDSTDGTAEVARVAADEDGRVRIIPGRPLPPGWLGKPHACWQLAQIARGEILAFMDADVHLHPGAISACVGLLDGGLSGRPALDMVSPYPAQITGSVAERMIQPLLQWSWLTFLPLRLAERAGRPSLTAANGQLQICRAEAYRGCGGHKRVAHEVIEDVALARTFIRAGFTVGMADGTDLATCRMYGDWDELREGYTKSLWSAFGSPAGALATMALLLLVYVVPPVAGLAGLVRRDRAMALLGLGGYLAGTTGRVVSAAATGGRIGDAPTHPVSVTVLAYLTWQSFHRRARGSLSWRGRTIT